MVPCPFSKNLPKTTRSHRHTHRRTPSHSRMKSHVLVVFLLACGLVQHTRAKRGCANFGHSCYGGMGKRAGATEEVAQEIDRPEENPALVFTGPRSEFRPERGPRFEPPRHSQHVYLSPFLRQWLRSLRSVEDVEE